MLSHIARSQQKSSFHYIFLPSSLPPFLPSFPDPFLIFLLLSFLTLFLPLYLPPTLTRSLTPSLLPSFLLSHRPHPSLHFLYLSSSHPHLYLASFSLSVHVPQSSLNPSHESVACCPAALSHPQLTISTTPILVSRVHPVLDSAS